MKSVRLLPVVICAALALLLFKSVGLMTQGGYVLTGVSFAQASGSTAGGNDAAAGGPTMADSSPTMQDASPTLPAAPAAGGHDAAPEPAASGVQPEAAAADALGVVAQDACAPLPDANGKPVAPGDVSGSILTDCLPKDGVPMVVDTASGRYVPAAEAAEANKSQNAVLESLGDRRTELETREAELAMRLTLIEAAEKRVAERQAALELLQAQVATLVDEKKAAEEAQFKGLVAMYETMKPKDAALIFNDLNPNVLLRVARAMNPRKMAPIMARMQPDKAQRLTVGLADKEATEEPSATAADLQALPQIVGQ